MPRDCQLIRWPDQPSDWSEATYAKISKKLGILVGYKQQIVCLQSAFRNLRNEDARRMIFSHSAPLSTFSLNSYPWASFPHSSLAVIDSTIEISANIFQLFSVSANYLIAFPSKTLPLAVGLAQLQEFMMA
jgi:hypothetical protein